MWRRFWEFLWQTFSQNLRYDGNSENQTKNLRIRRWFWENVGRGKSQDLRRDNNPEMWLCTCLIVWGTCGLTICSCIGGAIYRQDSLKYHWVWRIISAVASAIITKRNCSVPRHSPGGRAWFASSNMINLSCNTSCWWKEWSTRSGTKTTQRMHLAP